MNTQNLFYDVYLIILEAYKDLYFLVKSFVKVYDLYMTSYLDMALYSFLVSTYFMEFPGSQRAKPSFVLSWFTHSDDKSGFLCQN